MNTLIVNTECTASAPGMADQAFHVGDEIAPWSPFYWNLKWSGYAVDSGHEDASEVKKVFRPTVVVISDTDPELADGIWIEERGSGKWTMWFEGAAIPS